MKRKHWSGTVNNFRNNHFWRWEIETTKSFKKKKTDFQKQNRQKH